MGIYLDVDFVAADKPVDGVDGYHVCPFKDEINDDQTLCDCDEIATEQCAMSL